MPEARQHPVVTTDYTQTQQESCSRIRTTTRITQPQFVVTAVDATRASLTSPYSALMSRRTSLPSTSYTVEGRLFLYSQKSSTYMNDSRFPEEHDLHPLSSTKVTETTNQINSLKIPLNGSFGLLKTLSA